MRWAVPLLVSCTMLAAVEAEHLAAAWREGRYGELGLLLPASPPPGSEARLWRARWQQFTDPAAGLALLSDAAAWPSELRGFRRQVAAELTVAVGATRDEKGLQAMLMGAIEAGGERVEVDRCLAMLIDCLLRLGRADDARRCAESLWYAWPGSPWRPRAGLQLATLLAADQPDRAGAILHGVMAHPQAEEGQRQAAAEQLCHLLIDDDPAAVAVIAGRMLQGAEGEERWRHWRARADLERGRAGARAALAALSPACRRRYGVDELLRVDQPPAATARRQASARRPDDPAAALALLRPHVYADHGCLADWLSLGGDPSELDRPMVLAEPQRVLAVAAVLAARDPAAAAELLEAGVARLAADDPARPRLLQALERLLRSGPAAVYADVQRRLLRCDQVHEAVGEAWCRRARELNGGAAARAWEQAARLLPVGHPWLPTVAAQAARRRWLAWQQGGDEEDLAAVSAIAGRAAWQGDEEPHRRCRFLLAQAAVKRGEGAQARVLIAGLRPHADERQQRLLARLEQRLGEAGQATCDDR